ncbi:hypothetical protein RHMOL_Rhmol06G0003000 [Rhododendron molle]|uniref:Uncharacterized protein n=1 Tax=Rhododendron molle TaxID=49168 RepID=A0ACC0N7I7_RHOML|nr:hypothetical protein RHMOL_Rhmol06G0003000 [Rhododendron molle]
MRAARATELEEAMQEGYNRGWDAAGVEYKKQVREIENELYRDRFLDGLRFGHEALLQKLTLPEDSALRALPEAPPKELAMPEEEDEQVQNPEAGIPSEGRTTAPADSVTQAPVSQDT